MTNSNSTTEAGRRTALVAAEKRAEKLFEEIEQRGLLRPGRDEREIEKEIYSIALQEFGVEKHWHKRIVRSGPNTLTIAADNPPVRMIEASDIVYVDLGPVFEDWEADLGRYCKMEKGNFIGRDALEKAKAARIFVDECGNLQSVAVGHRTPQPFAASGQPIQADLGHDGDGLGLGPPADGEGARDRPMLDSGGKVSSRSRAACKRGQILCTLAH